MKSDHLTECNKINIFLQNQAENEEEKIISRSVFGFKKALFEVKAKI